MRLFSILFLVLLSALQAEDSYQLQSHSLLHYASDTYSQRGEDGVIQEICRRLDVQKGFFVEFGAWDGVYLSNTRLLVDQGWSGAFIEADKSKVVDLKRNYAHAPHILCIEDFVTWDEGDSRGHTINAIAKRYFPEKEIDILSIDVDGADYLILESLTLRPKVICVEGGFSWHPKFTQRVPDWVAFANLQQPLAVMMAIGRRLGYEPICFTQNLFLVRSDLYAPFADIANDPTSLWRDAWCLFPDKQWLAEFRNTTPVIRAIEGDRFKVLDLTDGD